MNAATAEKVQTIKTRNCEGAEAKVGDSLELPGVGNKTTITPEKLFFD